MYIGYSICTAPYTLCALAFTGGIGNDSLIAQMQGDTGDCATAFSPTCIGDLKAALGNAILDQANTNRTDGEMCRALSSEIVIPRSCGGISSVLNESISEGTSNYLYRYIHTFAWTHANIFSSLRTILLLRRPRLATVPREISQR